MKRALVIGFGALAASGCATLIGASFDDAGLVEYEAGTADVHEASLKFDVTDTKPFDPMSLPYVVLWLDAHQVDTSDASAQVSVWHDLSGHPNHDAVPYPSYGIPTRNATGINGQPSVHFESTSYQLLVVPGYVGPAVTQFTFFIVTQGYPQSAIRFQNAGGSFPVVAFPIELGAGGEQAPTLGFEIANSNMDYATARSMITPSATIAVAMFHASGTVTTYTNGSLVEQRVSTTKDGQQGTTLFIGGLPYVGVTPAVFTHGDIGEIIVYSDVLSDIDRSRVEDYLSVKWSIAL